MASPSKRFGLLDQFRGQCRVSVKRIRSQGLRIECDEVGLHPTGMIHCKAELGEAGFRLLHECFSIRQCGFRFGLSLQNHRK